MNNNKRITIEVDEKLFYKIKVYCAENKISVKELITNLITHEIL